jgi:sortase A
MSLRIRKLLILSLALAGAWQLGAGLYIHLKARIAQQLIASAWTRSLNGEHEVRPWPWADTWPIARLRVPAQDIDLYVLADASGRSLAFGPGYVSGSATPGTAGNTIIAAHRDTHFRFLQHLAAGTLITLQTLDGAVHGYEVNERHVIDVRRDYLDVNAAEPTLTLLTCYPFDALVPGGPLRYAVIAKPVAEVMLAGR